VATIAPEKPAETAPEALQGDCALVNGYDWDIKVAYAICLAESGGNARATNLNDKHNGCVGSYGLMQIACIHTGGVAEYNPEANMAKAYEIYSRSGWKPWGAYTSGAYLKYL